LNPVILSKIFNMKLFKRLGIGLVLVMALATGGFVGWTQVSRYPALPQAAEAATTATRTPQGWLVFGDVTPDSTGFIFYPGGLVDMEAYAPMAQALAERGITTIIVNMPLNLAILNPNKASEVLAAYPQISRWAIGGHSLGGSMAGQFLQSHPELASKIRGLVLWGSRLSAGIDVSALPIQAISIYGTNDGLAPPNLDEVGRRAGLPANALLVPVQGGNHGMFGVYGPQKGDNPASIPSAESQRQIVGATAEFLQNLP
jgi:acetyl esterase/lipase